MNHGNYSLFMSGHDDRDKGLDIFKLIQTHSDKGQLYIWNCTLLSRIWAAKGRSVSAWG